jgi:uncharacterized protein YmfQ (DUF2313 family)
VSNTIADLGAADFLAAQQRLLPPGKAMTLDPAALLTALQAALSGRMVAVHAQVGVLTEVESDPRQTVELLPDWEASFGLPDPCSPPDATIARRQAALVAKIASQGGQSPAYYISVALALGYVITITEFQAATFGHATFGSPFYDYNWEDAWQVNAPAITEFFAAFGTAYFGDPFASYSSTELGCVLNRLKPAHTKLILATE